METLTRVMDRPTPEALPDVYPSLATRGIHFRRGQMSILAAPPNGGKSFFGLVLVAGMGVPTLYFSADTDQFTMLARTAALVTHQPVSVVEAALRANGAEADDMRAAVARLSHVGWVWNSAPNLGDVNDEIEAFEEAHGELPALIVVDTLMNVVVDNDSEWSGMLGLTKKLHHLARATGAHVMVMHHTSEDSQYDPLVPAPRRAVIGKVSQFARLILTVAMNGGLFGVACTKNTSGPADPTGRDVSWFHADVSRMALSEALEGL